MANDFDTSNNPEKVDPQSLSSSGKLPPVIIIGGGANALSMARSLGTMGVKVFAINKRDSAVCSSRFATRIVLDDSANYKDVWKNFLVGDDSNQHRSSVLLAASDVGLEIIATNRQVLESKFLLDESNVAAQLSMLDKLKTYDLASQAGIPTPKFWTISSRKDLERVESELVFPLLIKPKSSPDFTDKFKGKFFDATNYQQVLQGSDRLFEAEVEFLLMEKIPGADDLLCSYYTYLDAELCPQFHFTKRIIRRNPPNMGLGCYHITDDIPEVQDVALRLFQATGLRGLANAEFKLDQRDGVLKLIECNARFTEANGLVAKSGFDLGRFVYGRIVGLPQKPMKSFRSGMRLLYPLDDFRSFIALRKQGNLTLFQWLKSLCHWQSFPLFCWYDPIPSVVSYLRRLKNWIRSPKN